MNTSPQEFEAHYKNEKENSLIASYKTQYSRMKHKK
jgi:hypothetical protein